MSAQFVMEQDSNPVTIVLVEDDDGDAKSVMRGFKKAKISNRVIRAVDGVEALEMLRGEGDHPPIPQPYIMLVDINMPRMNGIELVNTLRQDPNLKHTIVFVLTTSKNAEDKAAAYDLNVAGYILKETAGRDFLSLVALMENFWKVVEVPTVS